MVTKGRKKKSSGKKKFSIKKAKVKLDSRNVLFLLALIVFLCAVFVSLSLAFGKKKYPDVVSDSVVAETPETRPSDESVQEKPVEKPSKPKPEKKPQKNTSETGASQKNSQTVEPEKKNTRPENSVEQKNQDQAKPEPKPKPIEEKVEEKKTEKKTVPVAKFNIPQAVRGAKIAFVIDDAGLNVTNLKKYTGLNFPLTVAVLPKLSHTKECAQEIRASGKELILHQPMQAMNLEMNPGEGAIKPDMSLSDIYAQVLRNVAELGGGVKGINNHEGSLISADSMKIGAVLDAVSDSGIYFLDSRTTAQTQAPQAALERGMDIYERDVFIDDVINRDEMIKQIYRGIGIANKKGRCIMIGHVDKSVKILPDLLREMYPELVAKGYKITTPSGL